MTTRAEHAVYHAEAMLPDQWIAEESRNTIIPADSWRLHPRDRTDTGVWMLLAWLPRGGRHSSGFPGGLSGDERSSSMTIGDAPRDGTLSNGGKVFKTDFDVGEVAVSLTAVAHDGADWPALRSVLKRLRFDDKARPPVLSEARRGLDLARRWATDHGQPTTGIVYTGPIPGTALHGFTVFRDKGLTPLRIDPATGSVEVTPL